MLSGLGGGGSLPSAGGGSAGPAISTAESGVSGVTFGSVSTGSGVPVWLIIVAALVILWMFYGRRRK